MISRSEPSPPAFCAPILFFLFLRKKRIAAASEETRCIPFPAKAENFISAPFLFLSESRPLRWVAFRLILERKRTSKTGSANRAAIASEEASSIPFPPGRRKLHIRSLLLPSQIVTVSLGHNLAIWNFTTPHAILMMAVISLPANTAKSKTSMRRKSRARLWSIEGVRGNHPKGFPGRLFLFLAARHGSFLSPNRERKEWGRKIRFLF